jgi:hypothetical protein
MFFFSETLAGCGFHYKLNAKHIGIAVKHLLFAVFAAGRQTRSDQLQNILQDLLQIKFGL